MDAYAGGLPINDLGAGPAIRTRQELTMKSMRSLSVVACAIVMIAGTTVRANDLTPGEKASPPELLEQFNAAWDESHWTPNGYMLKADDPGWKIRMRVLRGLVAHGPAAGPVLLNALQSDSTPERILAAQALGYFSLPDAAERLLAAAKSDPSAAVRLYAVDSLGMQGATQLKIDWQRLLKDESNRDVRKHINYATERKQQALNPAVTRKLIDFDVGQIDSARVGQPAPDFALVSANGETVRLKQFRGKKAVVLVFIYGDT
jgi:hypothetical protein